MAVSRRRLLYSFLQKTSRTFVNTPDYKFLTTASALFGKAVASFEEVKSVKTRENSIYLIDVREPQELQETGVIPGSINIPVDEVESVLKDMSPESFLKKYGRAKPGPSSEIIFSCRSGVRSANAQEVAVKLGFKNVRNYEGGWLDWEERIKCS